MANAPSYRNGEWGRPDPPRLNDTSALVRKGTHPYELLVRGTKWTSPLETAWNAEHAFNTNGGSNNRGVSEIAVSPPYGCGSVVAVKMSTRSRNGRTADGNGTVPRSGTLATAVDMCEKC